MMVLVRKMVISHNYIEKYPKVLNEGDFPSTLTHLDMSHNLLTILPPDVANLKKLETLLLAGHYWEEGGLPLELANLNFLKTIDLSGETIRPDPSLARLFLTCQSGLDRTAIRSEFFPPKKIPMIRRIIRAFFVCYMILSVMSVFFPASPTGFPNLQEWLWRDEERARHGLLPSGQVDLNCIHK
jgi:Leucine-rich repeat (LRR) protein